MKAPAYGMEAPRNGAAAPRQPPARYLVLIASATSGGTLARLFLGSREEVAQFDAGAPEVQMMVQGLAPTSHASDADWDDALGQHSLEERAHAQVYTLEA